MLSMIAFWLRYYYSEEKALVSIKIFDLISFFCCICGILENQDLLPKSYYDILKNFYSYGSMSKLVYFELNAYIRPVSLLIHPTVFGLFMVFNILFFLKNKKNKLLGISNYFFLIIFLIAAIMSSSKAAYLGIVIIFVWEIIKVQKRYLLTITLCFVFLLISVILVNYAEILLSKKIYFVYHMFYKVFLIGSYEAFLNDTLYEFLLGPRFGDETGILIPAIQLAKNNIIFGIGYNKTDVFIGDSSFFVLLLQNGIIGLTYFAFVFFHIYHLNNSKKNTRNYNIYVTNFITTIKGFLMITLILSFFMNSIIMFKFSEIIYFYIFLIAYGRNYMLKKENNLNFLSNN